LPNKLKPKDYPEAYDVDVADRWKERLRSYPGRSHGRAVFVKRKIPHIINEKYPTFNKKNYF